MRIPLAATVVALLAAAACGQPAGSTGVGGTQRTASAPATSAPVTSAATTSPVATSATSAAPTSSPAHRHSSKREHLTQPVALPACPHASSTPHFGTPEAMMRYLAAAWNRDDLDALCHVTNPNARELLDAMHAEATNLRLDHCNRRLDGTYVCYLDHDYPASMHRRGTGEAVLEAAAADAPGWYMTVLESCG